jgi:hypothetical protein
MEDLQSSHVSEINLVREDFLKKGFIILLTWHCLIQAFEINSHFLIIERDYLQQIQEYETLKVDFHRAKENVC